MGIALKVPTEFSAVDKFTSVTKKMAAGVTKFSKNAQAAVSRFDNRVTKTFNKLGSLAKIGLGVGIAGIFSLAIQGNIAYNDSLASVASITGSTGDQLTKLEKISKNTARSQKALGADVLKAYELVGSAKPELLENIDLLDKVTNAAITLSKAGRLELAPASEALTTTLNQFGLSGKFADEVINNLAAGARAGSSTIVQTSEALAKFGTAAASMGVKVDDAISLIQLASPFERGAEAGTKLRNILGKISGAEILPPKAQAILKSTGVNTALLADKNVSLQEKLLEVKKVLKDSNGAALVFGEQNKALAIGVLNSADKFGKMKESVNLANEANRQATTNSNTLKFAIDSIKTAFINATTATNSNSTGLDLLKGILKGVANNMSGIITVLVSLISLYGLFKGVVLVTKGVIFAQNVVLGINTMLNQKNKKALIGNTVATNAYKVAMAIGTGVTWLATAATTAFGIALNLGLWPILLIIGAIVAVIAIIKNWSKITDWFGKKWKQFTGWISGLWNNVVTFFKEFSFVDFFKKIGMAIISFMLWPIKGILKLVSKLPGKIGELAQSGLDTLNELTGDVEAKVSTGDEKLPSPEEQQQKAINENRITAGGSIDLNIKDKGNNVESTENNTNGSIPVNVGSTQGAF